MVNFGLGLPSFAGMTYQPPFSGWRAWLGLDTGQPMRDTAAHEPQAPAEQSLAPREIGLPAKRRMLGHVADFLIDHDLDVLPFTLAVGYDCVTGANPHLAQRILERTEKGMPITLSWLEETMATRPEDATAEALAALVGELEQGLATLESTMTGVQQATDSYSQALEHQVTAMNSEPADNPLVARLTALTRHMLDHTRTVQDELAANQAQVTALQDRLEEARRLANHDHLTGLPNRRAFDDLYAREIQAARAAGETLCVAFCDIDHFKRVNDIHGHPAGDRVIRYVAETLGKIADAHCHVARHGGEEFAILLRGSSLAQAWARLDAARETIAQKRLINRTTDMPFGQITFSGGIADALAYPNRAAALKAADRALYDAKQAGRNCIVIAGHDSTPMRDAA